MEKLHLEHTSRQWRRFIDLFKNSFKAVLFHSGNKFPFITLALAFIMKETFENLQVLPQKIRYEEQRWNICADLQFIAIYVLTYSL